MKFLSTNTGTAINTKFIRSLYIYRYCDCQFWAVKAEIDDGSAYKISPDLSTEEEADAYLDRLVRALGGRI